MLLLFICEIVETLKKKLSGVFEINTVLFAELFLNIFSDAVKSLEYLSDPMVFVNNLIGVFKQIRSQ